MERNILYNLFTELKPYCQQKGWLLENVDLRWGVSKEAGWDNRTMQICLDELKRCQKLSPRPNFIILLGERYGWIPLPETVPYAHKPFIYMFADPKEEKLFEQWYRLDMNALPEGEFILNEREGRYKDYKVYAEEVEEPLRKLFCYLAEFLENDEDKIRYGASATEQEIYYGALLVKDAHEHVLAYHRQLQNVPRELQSVYHTSEEKISPFFSGRTKLRQLYEQVEKKIDDDRMLNKVIDYSYYNSEEYQREFHDQMYIHIKQLIDAEINQNIEDDLELEIKSHWELAQQEIQSFVGREEELKQAEVFLRNPESSYLWIQSDSGMGKSTFISKLVTEFKDDFNIICRFCDTTKSSGTATGLLCSIVNELIRLFPNQNFHNPFTYVSDAIMESPIYEELTHILTRIKSNKPLVIVLDGINQLNENNNLWFKNCYWLPYPKHTKIIISSTDEPKTLQEGSWEIIKLHGMKENPFKLIGRIFEIEKRTLSRIQMNEVSNSIERSDGSPLYLHLLGKSLLKTPSWRKIESIPTNTKGLIERIIEDLTIRQYHDRSLVKLSLSLFAFDRLGLSENELIDILSADNELYQTLMQQSFHQWDMHQKHHIPIVIWSRLFYDISYFLRIHQTHAGELIHIYHNLVKQTISGLFFNDYSFYQKTASLLNNYYKEHWENGDRHSVSEYPWTLYSLASQVTERKLLENLLTNINFISKKVEFYTDAIKEDYDLLITLEQNPETINQLVKLQNEIRSINTGNQWQFCAMALNLPKDSVLYDISHKQMPQNEINKVLKNYLFEFSQAKDVRFYLSQSGNYVGISRDGNSVVLIEENQKKVQIINLLNTTKCYSYAMADKIRLLKTDDTLQFHFILTETTVVLYDSINKETLYSRKNQNISWITISSDGKICASGNSSCVKLYINGEDWELKMSYIDGRLSHSGEYIWFIAENALHRMRLKDKASITYPLQQVINCCNELFCRSDTYISDCNDDWCFFVHKCNAVLIGTYYDANGKASFRTWYIKSTWEKRNCAAISRNGETVILSNQTGDTNIGKLPVSNDLEWYVSKHMRTIDLITPDFLYALSSEDSIIFSLQANIDNFRPMQGGNCGINSFTGSVSGAILLSSIGVNKTIDSEQDVLLFKVSEENINRKLLNPEFNNEYLYISASKVAPDGSFFVLTSFPFKDQKSEIIFYDDQYNARHCLTMGQIECTAITISIDSRYVATCHGSYFAVFSPVIILYSSKGKQLSFFFDKTEEVDISISDDIRFSLNNRYIFLCDYTLYIVDMKEKRYLENHIKCSSAPKPLVSIAYRRFLLAVFPDGRTIVTSADNQIFIQQLPSGKVKSIPSERVIMGCSPSGKYLYYLERKDSSGLFQQNVQTDESYFIHSGVCYVIPTLNDRYIYTIQRNNEIHLVNTETNEISQSYYMHNLAFHFSHTAKGLAVAQNNGDFLLLSPHKQHSVNIPALLTVVRHWNYELNLFDLPKASCPLCGHSFTPSNGVLETIKKYDGDTLTCMTISRAAWKEENLLNHQCPNCEGSLQFNPFMA